MAQDPIDHRGVPVNKPSGQPPNPDGPENPSAGSQNLRTELETLRGQLREARAWARLYYQLETYRVAYWGEFGLERGTEPEWLAYYDPWHPADESGDYEPSPLPWREQLRQAGILREL